jgi:hypothetical protein
MTHDGAFLQAIIEGLLLIYADWSEANGRLCRRLLTAPPTGERGNWC